MSNTLYAGAARKIINPPFGIKRAGIRLFADPLQAIETDLTATAVVLSNQASKVVIVAIDICVISLPVSSELRRLIGEAVGTPTSHVLININHTHSSPALPDFFPDSPEQMRIQQAYQDKLIHCLIGVAIEANQRLQPARIGAKPLLAYTGVRRVPMAEMCWEKTLRCQLIRRWGSFGLTIWTAGPSPYSLAMAVTR